MRSFLTLWICLTVCSLALAQNPAPTKPTLTTRPTANTNLPSEATVDAFLHQQFGYQGDLTWKIASIKPSIIPGLAEVNVVLASPQGQQLTRFYVSPDGEHALVGEIIPFGAHPFDPVKNALEKGVTGPSRGPKEAKVMIVEFGDLQCPACKAAQPTIEELVAAEYAAAGVAWPASQIAPELNEYDADSAIRYLAPKLAEQDEAFPY